MKRGFAQVVPLVAVLLLLVGGFVALSFHQQNSQKAAVGKVLSDRAEAESGGLSQPGEGGPSVISPNIQRSGGSNNEGENRPGNNSANNFGSSRSALTTPHIENNEGKPPKIEIKKPEIEQETNQEGNRVGTRSAEIREKEDIEVATGSGFVEHGEKVRTNFPLTVNPTTGQLFVTTPKGTKIVTILPQVAIQNMINAGILTTTATSAGPTTPPGGTGSATLAASVLGASTELTTDDNGTLIYKIQGTKNKKFLGFVPVGINLTAVVSAENGQLISTQEGFLTRLLDLLSF